MCTFVRISQIQFYIVKGFPAERETGERETNGSVVHNISTIGNQGQDLSVSPSPPPPLFNQLIRAVTWFATSLAPLYTLPSLHLYIIQRPYSGS